MSCFKNGDFLAFKDSTDLIDILKNDLD